MAKQNGALIKEKRTAAGMSQEALAKAAGGVTATDISKVERGVKDLSPEKLEAVAKALDVTPESLLVDERVSVTDEERELLNLYRSADADTQKAATSALKGEAPQNQNPMAAMMSMFGGMAGGANGGNPEGASSEEMAKNYFAGMSNGNGEGGANPMASMMGMMGGGEGGDNPMAGMMGMFGGMMGGGEGGANPMASMMGMMGGGEKKEEPAEGQNTEEPKAEE